MDPEMMRMAMETMSKMTPQQMAAMQQQMASIPQSVLQEQMRNIQNLTPEQRRMAAQQAQNFDPSSLPAQTSQFATSAAQRAFIEADSLKKEGNKLHGLGHYNSAVSKYEAASTKLQGVTSQEAETLITACKLNMASCYLNTGLYQKCIQQCNDVVHGDANNLKALFRRGQAYLAQGSSSAAVSDLQKAVSLAVPEEKGTIQAILDKALKAHPQSADPIAQDPTPKPGSSQLPDDRPGGVQATSANAASQKPTNVEEPNSPTSRSEADGGIEDIDLTAEAQGHASQAQTSTSQWGTSQAQGTMPSMERMMRDPDAMRAMQNMMASMDAQDMAVMQQQAARFGPASGLSQQEQALAMMQDPEAMRAMQNMMSKMRPEDMAAVQRQAGGLTPNSGGSQQEQVSSMMRDPGTVSAMQTMVSNMKSEDAAAVGRQGRGTGGEGSPGVSQQDQMMKLMQDPEMMKAMQGMMANMKPEDMAALQKQAAGMQGLQGGLGSQSQQMQAMMKDPAAMKAVQNMMSNMQPADLAAMYRQAGMNISDQQAEQMTSTLKNVSPEQMAKIMAAANFFQRVYTLLKKYQAVVLGLLALALGILWKLFFSRR